MEKLVKYFITSFLGFMILASNQNSFSITKIDSLKIKLQQSTQDSTNIKLLVEIASKFYAQNSDSVLYYAFQAYHKADSCSNNQKIGNSTFLIADWYFDVEKFTESVKYFLISKNSYEKIHDTKRIAMIYGRLAIIYYYQFDFLTSYDYYHKAMELGTEIGDTSIISHNLSNLSVIYYELKNFNKALECSEQALRLNQEIGNINSVVKNKIDIGDIHLKLGNFSKAIDWFKDAITHKDEAIDKEFFVEADLSMGESYLGLQKYDSAYFYLKRAHEGVLSIGKVRYIVFSHLTFGKYYELTGKFDQAIAHFQQGIALNKSIDMINEKIDLLKHLSNAYVGKNQYHNAYDALKRSTILSDSINIAETNRTIIQQDKKKELDKVQSDFLIEQEKRERQLENEAYLSRIFLEFAILAIIMLIITSVAIYRSYNIKKKVNKSLHKQNEIIKNQKILLEKNIHTLEERELELKELNATKDKFFSIIAHDLKNPFSSLIGFSDLLIHEPSLRDSEEKLDEVLHTINKTATLSYDLLENLLHWAQSQTGKLKVIPENFDIKSIIDENILFFNDQSLSKQITLLSNLKDSLFVYGDVNMINTVIRNLISNAIKFTHKGGTITVSGTIDNNLATICVADTGIGIKKDDIDKLFSIDRSLKKPGTDNEMGTGLGLILCDEFIRKNNGTLFVESELGKGSAFSFTLPLPIS